MGKAGGGCPPLALETTPPPLGGGMERSGRLGGVHRPISISGSYTLWDHGTSGGSGGQRLGGGHAGLPVYLGDSRF